MEKKTNRSKTTIKGPVKVIHMAPLGTGGITNLTVTINGLLDPARVQFDYLVFRDQHEFMEDTILALGAKKQVVDMTKVKIPLLRPVYKIVEMTKLFRREKYDVVHVDASTPYDMVVAIAAKLAGVKTIVFHSHNDSYTKGNPLRDLSMPIFKGLMPYICTHYFAISEPAAQYMFPKPVLEKHRYRVVKNGILAENYAYSPQNRQRERQKLHLMEDHYVIGNVGRFVYQKNHEFMIDVFAEIYKEHQEARLLLIGEGTLEEELWKKVSDLGLTDAVIFYGVTHDVPAVLSAMDSFIFPSHYEGLGIVSIEAQTSGLPVWCADTIVDEANICETFYRIHGWDAQHWAKEIWEHHADWERRSYIAEARAAGYDIRAVAGKMQRFYLRVSGRA